MNIVHAFGFKTGVKIGVKMLKFILLKFSGVE